MSEAAQVPQLRFPEFGGEWINQKAGDFFEQLSGFSFKGKDISEEVGGTSILRGINITEGSIRHSQKIDKYYLGDVSNLQKYIVQQGDIVLGMDGSKVGKNVAVVSSADTGSILIQRVARLRDNGVGCIQFIYHHIFSYRFHRYVDVVNTSSGIPHISAKQINDFPVVSPTKPEQQKIAAFLTAVDTKIEQLSKKQKLLGEYKKGLMQQIFSQEIRFKSDDGGDFPDWEEKKLKDISTFYNGRAYKQAELLNRGKYPVLRVGNFYTNKSWYYSDLELDENKYCDKGDLLYAWSASFGPKIWDGSKVIYHYHIWKVINHDSITKQFLYILLDKETEKIKTQAANGFALLHITKGTIENWTVVFPGKPEQQKIVVFLNAVDNKIEQVGKQLDESKQFKKALLQQMFV